MGKGLGHQKVLIRVLIEALKLSREGIGKVCLLDRIDLWGYLSEAWEDTYTWDRVYVNYQTDVALEALEKNQG